MSFHFRLGHEQHGLCASGLPLCVLQQCVECSHSDPSARGHHVPHASLWINGKSTFCLILPVEADTNLTSLQASDLKDLPPSPFLPGGLGLVRPEGFPNFQVLSEDEIREAYVKEYTHCHDVILPLTSDMLSMISCVSYTFYIAIEDMMSII